jgi:hypothetical protein
MLLKSDLDVWQTHHRGRFEELNLELNRDQIQDSRFYESCHT